MWVLILMQRKSSLFDIRMARKWSLAHAENARA